jgi:hypothetical protein
MPGEDSPEVAAAPSALEFFNTFFSYDTSADDSFGVGVKAVGVIFFEAEPTCPPGNGRKPGEADSASVGWVVDGAFWSGPAVVSASCAGCAGGLVLGGAGGPAAIGAGSWYDAAAAGVAGGDTGSDGVASGPAVG